MKKENNVNQRAILFRLLSYTKPHKKTLILAFALLFFVTVGDIIGPLLVKVFIDDYLVPRNLEVQPLLFLAATYLLVHITKVFLQYFQLVKFQEIALKIIQELRIDVFSKVQKLGLKYFDQTPDGSIVSKITNDTEAIKEMFIGVLSTFVQNSVLLLGVFCALFFLNMKLAVFCLLILPIILFIMNTYRNLSSKYYRQLQEKLSGLNTKLNESLQGMAIIQVFKQEKRLRKEFENINEEHYQAGVRKIKLDGLLLRPAIDLVYIISLLLILSFFGIHSFEHPIEIGVIYAFVNYLDRFFEPINQMMVQLSTYQQAIISASRVFELIDHDELAPGKIGDDYPKIDNGLIEFKNVSFSYDGVNKVLKNISFQAKQGETVALVGHTGSGKSSIINLLMRFYQIEQGEILIDEHSIYSYEEEELRKKMGLVLQDPFLFAGTIKQNIRLHNEDITDEEIIQAAKFVQANLFIEKLPKGYNTYVTERGTTFSSGERQLIAFARTIAINPKILILDEATASIDTETEEAIQVALEKMRKGRTTIAIAHRLSTIQDADLILVLHHGEIVERGTHQELLSKKGLYYKMYLLQNGSSESVQTAMT